MSKARRVKAARKGDQATAGAIGDERLPHLLSPEDERQIAGAMRGTLEALPEFMDFMPCPIDVYFMHEEGTGRWMSLFTLGDPKQVGEGVMRVETLIKRETMQRAVDEGQEPLWEWLRDTAAQVCVQALLNNMELPHRIGLQLGSALRSHDIDRDPVFEASIREAARLQAMSAMMRKELSE